MIVIAIGSIVLGSFLNVALALLLLPVLGMTRSTVEVVSRLLLQRSAPPTDLGALFAALEMTSGVGLILGSLLVQVLIAGWGADAALIGLGVTFAALTVATIRSLRHADDSADIPVVAMSMLRRLPVFAPLPPLELEAVARSAEEITTTPAERVVTQGEPGDVYYAVTDGQYDVTIDGRYIRTIQRGGSFGEIALLADVPRTATVTSHGDGSLLAVQRADVPPGRDRPRLVAASGVGRGPDDGVRGGRARRPPTDHAPIEAQIPLCPRSKVAADDLGFENVVIGYHTRCRVPRLVEGSSTDSVGRRDRRPRASWRRHPQIPN